MLHGASSTGYVRNSIREHSQRSSRRFLASIASEYLPPTSERADPGPLLDFIPKTSPKLKAPTWYQPVVDAFERSISEPVFWLFSSAPRHGKSQLCFHFLAWALIKRPDLAILYLTYSEDFALSQMRKAKPLAMEAGVPFASDSKSFTQWYTTAGGSLSANGMLGAATGKDAKVVIIDDPFKDWKEAHSKKTRENKWDWLRSVVISRLEPDTSVIIFSTRWHEEDIHGKIAGDPEYSNFEVRNFPAIDDEGEALAPEIQSKEFLLSQRGRAGEYIWSALWQGRPRPIGGEVFGAPTYCELKDIPAAGRDSIGLDLAYTAKTSADYSVSVHMRADPLNPKRKYVVNVIRKQVEPKDFIPEVNKHKSACPGVMPVWRCSGMEKRGVASLLRQLGLAINAKVVGTDKFIAAQPVAAAWNRGEILVPVDAPWARVFVEEVCSFTGDSDTNDDQVDGLGSAYDGQETASSGKVDTIKRGRTRALRGAF